MVPLIAAVSIFLLVTIFQQLENVQHLSEFVLKNAYVHVS
jgi:hypothetical protein